MHRLPVSEMPPGASCGGGCSGCHQTGDAPPPVEGGLSGVALVLSSILFFVVPIVTGILGAALAGPDLAATGVGGIAGLLLGMIVTTLIARRIKPSAPPRSHE